MDKAFLTNDINGLASKSIFISGCARSGTTILGRLVGTLDKIEYFYEPPFLFQLFANLSSETDSTLEKNLFAAYVIEDLLMNSLAGRNINTRVQDNSSIYGIKSAAEIARRLKCSGTKAEIMEEAVTLRPAFKVPDFAYKQAAIGISLNLSKNITCIREPKRTIQSILKKSWLSDESLLKGTVLWPNRFNTKIPTPHWVPERYLSEWDGLCEFDRSCIYYISQMSFENDGRLIVDYSDLLTSKEELINKLTYYLNARSGFKTQAVLDSIKETENLAEDIISVNQLKRSLYKDAEAIYESHRELID